MPDAVHPAFLYLLGALIVPFLRGRFRQVFALAIPVIGFLNFFLIEKGVQWTFQLLDFELILGRGDEWTFIFLNIFTILSFVGILYILKENRAIELSAGLLYAGSAMGVVMAGDLLTMFFFWEMLTLGAVLCILARQTPDSGKAAYRYLLVHVFGGVVLLAGLAIHISTGLSEGLSMAEAIAFDKIGLSGAGSWLMFIGFGINCAWPIVGAWLTDTYPEASIGGVIFMATYTTKTAVFVLARTFPGEESLLWIGVVMATLPLIFAVIANDLRRVLAYALINQVGFMMIGVGLGTPLSLNGAAAHAYCHILYKALLFMSIGSVLYRTGKCKATELGGLYRSMPWTCIFCCIGAVSMSAPMFCGFVSKSMIISSAASGEGVGTIVAWCALLFASAGVFLVAGIKVPFFAFFSRDSGIRCKEAPGNQLIAMGIVAFMCIIVGTVPNLFLYKMLPTEATYQPYTVGHVTDQLALLLFTGLAFTLLLRSGVYPAEVRSTVLDFDWLYRKGGPLIYKAADRSLNTLNTATRNKVVGRLIPKIARFFTEGPSRILCLIVIPAWKLLGLSDSEIELRREKLYMRSRRGAFPIGITAILAVILLGVLYGFNWLVR